MWNVPHISAAYLIQKQVLSEMKGIFTGDKFDPDMTMCKNLREKVSSDLSFLKIIACDLVDCCAQGTFFVAVRLCKGENLQHSPTDATSYIGYF